MRDEELALRQRGSDRELPPDLEFEEFSEIREQLAAMIEEALKVYQEQQMPLNLAAVMRALPGANIRVRVISTWHV